MFSQFHPLVLAGIAAAVCAFGQPVPVPTAPGPTISGHVYGPNGLALAGATVWANLVSALPRPVDRNSIIPALSTVSTSDGSFTLFHVPAGDYVLCANHKAAGALNPCAWGGAPLVTIANGLDAASQTIRMAGGAMLQVHLDDPNGFLAAHAGKPGASLIIGLSGAHGFVPLSIAGSTAISRDYSLLVPYNITQSLVISSKYFQLTNASGPAIGTGASTIPVTIPSGTLAQVINLRIAGISN